MKRATAGAIKRATTVRFIRPPLKMGFDTGMVAYLGGF
jgi:hypothetical protein